MYHIVTYLNPKGRTPQAHAKVTDTNKRNAVRRSRKILRATWRGRPADVKMVRVAVYAETSKSTSQLLYQARIDKDTAQNGWRRMIKDEEL